MTKGVDPCPICPLPVRTVTRSHCALDSTSTERRCTDWCSAVFCLRPSSWVPARAGVNLMLKRRSRVSSRLPTERSRERHRQQRQGQASPPALTPP